MNKELEEQSTIQLINDITNIGNQIDLLCLEYEEIRLELIRRFPNIKNDEEFQPKKLIRKMENNNEEKSITSCINKSE